MMSKKLPLFVGFGLGLTGAAAVATYIATNPSQARSLGEKAADIAYDVADTVLDAVEITRGAATDWWQSLRGDQTEDEDEYPIFKRPSETPAAEEEWDPEEFGVSSPGSLR